jgi:hypothetical protein
VADEGSAVVMRAEKSKSRSLELRPAHLKNGKNKIVGLRSG